MSSSRVERRAALATRVHVNDDTLSVDLADGRTIAAPLAWYPRLWHRNAGGHCRGRLGSVSVCGAGAGASLCPLSGRLLRQGRGRYKIRVEDRAEADTRAPYVLSSSARSDSSNSARTASSSLFRFKGS